MRDREEIQVITGNHLICFFGRVIMSNTVFLLLIDD